VSARKGKQRQGAGAPATTKGAKATTATGAPIPKVSFLDAMQDTMFFRPWFASQSWETWHTFAKALFGAPMTAAEVEVFSRCTGRQPAPTVPAREAWLVVGRRGGKSLFAAALAVYMACLRDYRARLKPGERAVVMVLAADRDQATVVFDYIKAFFENVPLLEGLVERSAKESIQLTNRVTIRVQVASFRRLRGRTVACAILDECAFWYNDEASSNPDTEILKALRPSMLTIPNSLLIAISSPYAKRGILWDAFESYYGKDENRRLVWKADTETMNPTVDREEIERAYQDDPAAARAEYGAEFREDLETYVGPEALARVTVAGRSVLPWEAGLQHYAFVDVAGGSGMDSMALCVAVGRQGKTAVARLAEWRPPFSPEQAVQQAAEILAEYRLKQITGDPYAKEWPVERFAAHGITYKLADQVRSDYYEAFLPMINSQRVELLDHPRSLRQLAALERRTSLSGRPVVGHPPRGHDDLANVIAGACVGLKMVRQSGFEVIAVPKRTAWSRRVEDESWLHPHERRGG